MTLASNPAGELSRQGVARTKAGAAALSRSVGAAARTSQTIGIEWMDYLKQVSSEVVATTEKVVKAGSPVKAMTIQGDFVKAAGELWMARAGTFRDLYATLATDMAGPFAKPFASPLAAATGRSVAAATEGNAA